MHAVRDCAIPAGWSVGKTAPLDPLRSFAEFATNRRDGPP
jgi:hypothetical protein